MPEGLDLEVVHPIELAVLVEHPHCVGLREVGLAGLGSVATSGASNAEVAVVVVPVT